MAAGKAAIAIPITYLYPLFTMAGAYVAIRKSEADERPPHEAGVFVFGNQSQKTRASDIH
jgi:hypothetical protein